MGVILSGVSPVCLAPVIQQGSHHTRWIARKKATRGEGNGGRVTDCGKEACECMGKRRVCSLSSGVGRVPGNGHPYPISPFIVSAYRPDCKQLRCGIRSEPSIVGKSTLRTNIHSRFGFNGRAAVSSAIWLIGMRERRSSSIIFRVPVRIKYRHTVSHANQLLLHHNPMYLANICSRTSEINNGLPVCDFYCCPRDHSDKRGSHKERRDCELRFFFSWTNVQVHGCPQK
jgi:hypothetical protein